MWQALLKDILIVVTIIDRLHNLSRAAETGWWIYWVKAAMVNECSGYPDNSWIVLRLKEFLKNIGGCIQGKKIDLTERVQFYRSNPCAGQSSTCGKSARLLSVSTQSKLGRSDNFLP